MSKERTRLKLDLDALLPGDTFTIGSQDITIRPLGLRQYKTIVGNLKSLTEELKSRNVTLQNYNEPESLIEIADVLVNKFPEVLEEVSNISQDDLDMLPIDVIVALIDKCLDVNLKSKDALLGNWNSLLGKMNPLMMEKKGGSQK